ncbi:hypothetical protein GCM10023231_33370 [Olivibacter ginsenosidimutans]|uniref:Xylose isomerase-like TIM barrel domain-containing protein n=1 Tax=Olivibacter ginsenosidimutans TaxID=1176537 RepID=A0ABP9C061_9SPHI
MDTRRNFLKKGALGVVASTLVGAPQALHAAITDKAAAKEDSFKLGMAGYSFLHFNLDESLAMMKKVDVHYLCIKDFHLPLNSTDEQIAAFHAKLKASGVTGYGVGPIYMKTKEEIDKAFDYAKRVGVNLLIGIPNHEDLPYVSEKAKEYDIHFAIHNHGPQDKLYPNATVVYNLVKDLDPRMGLCLDIGHNTRDGQNLINDINKYKDRIFDMHLKNVTAAKNEGTTCELDRGVIDVLAFVKTLRKIKYTGTCGLEYEKDMKDPLAGIAESIGYFRGICDGSR